MYVEFEPGQKYAAKKADISDTCENFRDAGYLLEKSDLVVDIDELPKEKIEKLLATFHINTQTVWTERGAHLYFKKPQNFRGATKVCPLGFPIEFKHSANTQAVTIKRNGIMRKVENEGVREDLPGGTHGQEKI